MHGTKKILAQRETGRWKRIYLQRFRNHMQKACVLVRDFDGKDGLALSQCREEIEERSERD